MQDLISSVAGVHPSEVASIPAERRGAAPRGIASLIWRSSGATTATK